MESEAKLLRGAGEPAGTGIADRTATSARAILKGALEGGMVSSRKTRPFSAGHAECGGAATAGQTPAGLAG